MSNSISQEIYQRHVDTVFRVCFTYMKNVADTEDVTADTFVKLLKANPTFKSEEHEKAWLIRTATNVCKDALKHWWRKREDIADYSEVLSTRDAPFEEDEVTQAVLDLPEKYKGVVYLYYYEGYNAAQIAKALRKPHSTIRNYLHEARELLRAKLGGDYERE